MKFEVRLEGLPEHREKIRAAPDLLKRYLLGAFIESAAVVAQAASRTAPKKSGELAGSMRIDVKDRGDQYEVTVGPTAFYAGWVEHGHQIGRRGERVQARLRRALGIEGAKVPAHPFFFPAVALVRSDISATIREAIERAERESA